MKLFIPYNQVEPVMPLYTHECQACKYVGQTWRKSGARTWQSDVYICGTSIIERRSDEPSDYLSGDLHDLTHIFLGGHDGLAVGWLASELLKAGILKVDYRFEVG